MIISPPQTRGEAPWHCVGMGLSALCLVHCLALPWLLASLPVLMLATLPDAVRDNEWLHAVLILPVLLVSGPVLLRDQPGTWQIGLVLTAFAALIGGLFVGSETGEQALTVTGAALLLAAHWARLRRGHRH
ncbi:MAG TPA: MerC domain-containing protein [Erythrobacter sp.]|nr:MerC domain-containing protein [Erythrobacter sp.]